MALEGGFSRLNWSDQEAQSQHNWAVQGLNLGVAAAVGGAGFMHATSPRFDGTRPIDDLANYARTLGNLSPMQVGNTLRVPEWLSPFTSPAHQGLTPTEGGRHIMEFSAESLKNDETYLYLKKLTGLNAAQMNQLGLPPQLVGEEGKVASSLVFEKAHQADINGRLYSVVNGERKLLHSSVALAQFTAETPNVGELWSDDEPVNKVAKSVFANMDMYAQGHWKEGAERRVFSHTADGKVKRPRFIPIPGVDIAKPGGTTYFQAAGSFSMERFNQLLHNTSHELLGKGFTNVLKRFGLGTGVVPGPASHMYGRFGAKVVGVLGVGLAINESDWIRRQTGVLGQAGVSAGVSFGLGSLVAKAGFGPKAGFFAGLASFADQMVLPGFDQGILPGVASTYAMTKEYKATAVNPVNYYRRTLEGLLPGISSFSTGMGVGVALAVAAHVRLPGTGQTLPSYLLNSPGGHKFFGIARRTVSQMDVRTPKTTKDLFWDMTLDWAGKNVQDPQIAALQVEARRIGGYTNADIRSKTLAAMHREHKASKVSQVMNTLWSQAEDKYKSLESANPLNQALKERLEDIDVRYAGKSGMLNKFFRQAEGLGEQLRHSFFGADVAEEGMHKLLKQKGFLSAFGRTGMLFAAGFLGHQVLTGALLGSMESREELQDIYSGRQLVEVGKGRWWEMSGLPDTGAGYGQFRPHWYPLMMNRVKQKGTWGASEDRIDPIGKFILSNFTHELEKRNYYDRPYPISMPAFGNVPIIGGLLSATIGQLIKPPRLMHVNEWTQTGDQGQAQFAYVHEGWKREPAYNLGAAEKGIPMSPFNAKSVYSDFAEQYKDLSGLTGFLTGLASKAITGEDKYFTDTPRLAQSGEMTSLRRGFWDLALGGAGPFGEVLRRILPAPSNDYEQVNPLRNTMACLPPHTEVLQPDGSFIRADELRVGTTVIDADGVLQIIEAISARKVNSTIRIISTGSNVFTSDFSEEHPLLIKDKGFVEAKDVVKGDSIAFPRRKPIASRAPGKIDISTFLSPEYGVTEDYIYYGASRKTGYLTELASSYNFNIEAIPLDIKQAEPRLYGICRYRTNSSRSLRMSRIPRHWEPDDLFYLLGVYAAEGSLQSSSTGAIKLSGHPNDKWEARILDILYRNAIAYSVEQSSIRMNVIIYARPLGDLLRNLCPGHAKDKRFSNIANLDPSYPDFLNLLSGLIDGDGYWMADYSSCNRSRYGLRTTSKQLLSQFRTFCVALFGIAPSTTVDKHGYHIFYSGKNAREVQAAIVNKFELSLSKARYQIADDEFNYLKVKEVRTIEKPSIVIGCMVSNSHTFNTVLFATHNSWLPREFSFGDPFTRMPFGEGSLPGPGYEALHPELQGVDPEDYPLVYRYDILSQVSPRSSQLRNTRDALYRARQAGRLSPEQEDWVDRIDRVVTKQWNTLEQEHVNARAIELPGISSLTQALWSGGREKLREYAAPLEYLTPMRPLQKFMGDDRDAIERYEWDRMYGSGGSAFWDKPGRDFLRPMVYSLAYLMGYDMKPLWRVQADATNKYFDELEFNKWMTLAQQAQAMGDTRQKISYEYQAANTRMGVNPMGNPLSIYWSLPDEDRAYFNSFAFTEGADRDRVLSMVPSDQRSLYQTLWSRMDEGDPELWSGIPTSPNEEYLQSQYAGLDQGDMPPLDWIGANADVDISDIKIRYIDELAKDYHDFGHWESEERKAYSQPFLEGSTAVIHQEMGLSRGGLTRNLREMFGGPGTNLRVFSSNANLGTTRLEYNDDRQADIAAAMPGYLGSY